MTKGDAEPVKDPFEDPEPVKDPFETDTKHLNSKMRTAINALRSQINENPAAPQELREALGSLNEAAVKFTNTLYRDL